MLKTLSLPLISLALLAAAPAQDCGEPPAKTCDQLTEDECNNAQGCQALYGAPADDYCADDYSTWMSIYGGCTDVMGCGDAITCGISPAGEVLIFPSTCQPDGWETCEDPCR